MTAALAQPALREVRLYGHLGQRFGRLFRLAVANPAEAVRALRAVLPGFEQAFVGKDGNAAYHVLVGRRSQRRDISAEQAIEPIGATEPIRFVPAVVGAKRAGLGQTIVGAVLVVVGLLVDFYSYGTMSGGSIESLGYAMMVGGVIQLLSPQRVGKDAAAAESTPSYAFNGSVNNIEQGGPVSFIAGRVICGSVVVSQGLSSDDIVVGPSPPAALVPVDLPAYEPVYPEGGE